MDRDALAACSDDDLSDAIGQTGALESVARRALLELIVELERRDSWRADGATSLADWLVMRLGYAYGTARELVRVARALERLPAIAAAFGEGRLGWDQVRALARFATPARDAELAEEARGLSAVQLEGMARRSRAADAEAAAGAHLERSVRWRYQHDRQRLRLTGEFPASEGATVVKALERGADRVPRDPVTGLRDPFECRAADALFELASQRLATDAGRDPDRATLVVHADVETLTGASDTPAEIERGPVLTNPTMRRLACDARIQLVAHALNGAPVGIGRASRTIPPWLARQLRHRDRTCVFPGCGRDRWLHGHHLIHWIDGGPTDLTNLGGLCTYHHWLVHEGGWSATGNPESGLVFRDPKGRVLMTGPTALRPEIRDRLAGALGPTRAPP